MRTPTVRRIALSLFGLVSFAFLAGCQWPEDAEAGRRIYGQPIIETFTAGVIGVTDGDTITVVDSNNKQYKVRLVSIDCPEAKQPFSVIAKVTCSTLCYLKTVDIQQTGVDGNDRILAFVIADGVNVNAELIRLGVAWHYTFHTDSAELAALEKAARLSKVGLWEDKDPIPPWQWLERSVAASKSLPNK